MKNKFRVVMFVLFFFLFAKNAFANAGTPLMWVGILHLVVGNAVIGIIEGVLISKIFKVRKRRSITIMILANYISMIAGSFIVGFTGRFFSNLLTIYSIHLFLLASFMVVFLLTVLIEWPFCYWILRVDTVVRKQSFRASLYAQILSYALLIPFYFLASGTSLLWNVKIQRDLSFARTNPWVYFINENGKSVERIELSGKAKEKVCDISANSKNARLFAKKAESGSWDLWLKDRKEGAYIESEVKILDGLSTQMAQLTRWDGAVIEEPDGGLNFGVVDYRKPDDRYWKVRTGFWAIEGLRANNEKEGKKFYIALETPFVQWYMRNVTILPSDQVVFQIGDQIVLLDIESHKMGLVTKGRGPLVKFGN